MLLLATIKGWSINLLHQKLTAYHDPTYRQLLGVRLSQIPSRRTLNNHSHHPSVKAFLEKLLRRLLTRLLNSRNLSLIAIDMTDIPRSRKDHLARWGATSDDNIFYGYKLHLIVTRDGVIIAFFWTTAEKRESRIAQKLFNQVRRCISERKRRKMRVGIGDEGYDAKEVYELAFEKLGIQMIIPPNPRKGADLRLKLSPEQKEKLKERGSLRDKGILEYGTKKGRKWYHKRVVIEEVIDQLKHSLDFLKLPKHLKGVRRITEYIQRSIVAFNAILLCNKSHRSNPRNLAPYLA